MAFNGESSMTRKRQDLFERVEVELYPLGGEISKRI